MKRDLDLIRLLLLRAEGDEQAARMAEQYDVPVRAFHVALMLEAGMVVGSVSNDQFGVPAKAFVVRLTWAGYEFVDAARSDTVWNTVKAGVAKAGVSIGVPILLEMLKLEAKKHLGPLLP